MSGMLSYLYGLCVFAVNFVHTFHLKYVRLSIDIYDLMQNVEGAVCLSEQLTAYGVARCGDCI